MIEDDLRLALRELADDRDPHPDRQAQVRLRVERMRRTRRRWAATAGLAVAVVLGGGTVLAVAGSGRAEVATGLEASGSTRMQDRPTTAVPRSQSTAPGRGGATPGRSGSPSPSGSVGPTGSTGGAGGAPGGAQAGPSPAPSSGGGQAAGTAPPSSPPIVATGGAGLRLVITAPTQAAAGAPVTMTIHITGRATDWWPLVVEFGDGERLVPADVHSRCSAPIVPIDYTQTVTHTYARAGSYTITAVAGVCGVEARGTAPLTVTPPATPAAQPTPAP